MKVFFFLGLWSLCTLPFLLIAQVPQAIQPQVASLTEISQAVDAPATRDDRAYLLAIFSDADRAEEARVTCDRHEDFGNYQRCISSKYQLTFGQDPNWAAFEAQYDRQLARANNVSAASKASRTDHATHIFSASVLAFLGLSVALSVMEYLRRARNEPLRLTHLHGWLIDAPPILGISGTLLALIIFLAQIDGGDALTLFLPAFSTAAVTTLAGGLAAVVNQFLLATAMR